jgi:putative membrane protein (TIGR04086 family)
MRKILRGCLLSGLPVSLILTAALAALLTAFDLPLLWYPAAAALPLLAGCFCAGFTAGKAARFHGLRCGAAAAFLLCLLWYAAVCITGGGLRNPLLMLIALPCGMCGGICGVNTRQPVPRRHSHTALHLRENAVLRRKTMHKPKKQPVSTSDPQSE